VPSLQLSAARASGLRGFRRSLLLDHSNYIADVGLCAFRRLQVLYDACHWRRQFDDGLIGLHFGDSLVLFDLFAFSHMPLFNFPGRDALAQVRQLELVCQYITT
jgi:hypothetical protein